MKSSLFFDSLWLTAIVVQAAWAVRIWKSSLTRRYPILVLYLTSGALLQLVGYFLFKFGVDLFGQPGYLLLWVTTRPLDWALLFLLMFEVYRCLLEDYHGLRRLGTLVLYSALASVAVLIGLLAYADPVEGAALERWSGFWSIVERDIFLAVGGVVFLLLMFIQWFHLKTTRNVQLIFLTFGLYFMGVAAFSILRTYVGPSFNLVSNMGSLILYSASLGVGAVLFSPAGEVKPKRKLSPAQYTEAVGVAARKLDALNRRLAEVLR